MNLIDVMFNMSTKYQGTHTQMTGTLNPEHYDVAKEVGTAWYRSKKSVPIHRAFVGDGYLSNKKWPLIEECTS